MQIHSFMAAVLITLGVVNGAMAQSITFAAEEKTITPTTTSFTFTFTATNNTEAAIAVSSVTMELTFSPGVAENINLANVSFPETPTWSAAAPDDTLLKTSIILSGSSGSNYMLQPGEVDFMVLDLELKQPGPALEKYMVSFGYVEMGDTEDNFPDVGGVSGFIAVPEPGSVVAIGSLAGLLLMRRRRAA